MTAHEQALMRDVVARSTVAVRRAEQRAALRDRQATHWRDRAQRAETLLRHNALHDELLRLRARNRWLEDELLAIGVPC
jgi:hypothetical protein